MTTTEQSTVKAFIDTDKNALDMPLPTSTPAGAFTGKVLSGTISAIAPQCQIKHPRIKLLTTHNGCNEEIFFLIERQT